MSQENVELVRRGYQAFNRGDLDAVVEGLSPDFEWSLPPMLPEADAYQGREGLRRFWGAWRDSFEGFRIEIEEVIDADDKVVVMAAVCGTGRDSGAEVRSPSFPQIWSIQGNQVIRMEALPNRAAALEAVGLAE